MHLLGSDSHELDSFYHRTTQKKFQRNPNPETMSQYELSILPQELFFVTIEKGEFIPNALITLLISPEPSTFVSLIDIGDNDEFSLILDESSLGLLPPDVVSVEDSIWKVIEVHYPEMTLESVGFIRKFSKPLFEKKIFTVYLSTFNRDLIIVKEEDIDEAFDLLKKVERGISTSFTSSESDENLDFFITKFQESSTLLQFEYANLPNLTKPLLQSILRSSRGKYLSVTYENNEVTLVIGTEDLQFFKEFSALYTTHQNPWICLEVSPGYTGTSSGIVSKVSQMLAVKKIPMYYQATTTDDYIMVPKSNSEEAVACLTGE
eukprot:TRINITY_DN5476_c0_g1_i1.p1 TRINITY_DN5476_c0_g1~~TRINITY_DN5476_c0_g1_i1.p1  ORF type:complete len:320 (-),score=65.45 TRINITY_DN5476_c0_g1_i1:48-1007(-)